jgi:glutathione synthase/RimK-type ligase-like ATP-grasp enzyme
MILILTEEFDPHTDHVAARLAARGAEFTRFNTAAFPAHAALGIAYDQFGLTRATLAIDEHPPIELNNLTSVWFRRPQPPAADDRIADQLTRRYLNQECATVLNDLWHALECPVVPAPPNTLRRAELKAAQLNTAGRLGFELPPTLITSNPQELLDFYRAHNGQIISKLPSSMLYQHAGQTFNRYTHVVSTREIACAEAVRQCPIIFQAYVPKRLEVRATVVGKRVFAAEIYSQQTQRTRYDWRRYDHYETPYGVHALPAALAQQCVALVETLGLSYGTIDLVLTPDGRYVFLEINPNGQYLWVEEATGLPISDALCDLLMHGAAGAADAALPAAFAGAFE